MAFVNAQLREMSRVQVLTYFVECVGYLWEFRFHGEGWKFKCANDN